MTDVATFDHRRLADRIDVSARTKGLAGLVAFGFVLAMAADDGAYFPTAWGWSALALLWLVAIALVVSEAEVTAVEVAAVGAFLAVFAWVLTSALWTSSVTRTFLEAERVLVYPAALAALLLLVRRGAQAGLTVGIWAGITGICTYGLATRFFPERLGLLDAVAGYRLSQPIGYWNGLGLFAAMGALLAMGLISRSRNVIVRGTASSSLLVLVPTVYFTFSRGAWLALALGLIVAISVDPRRLQLIASVLVAAPLTIVGLLFSYEAAALNRVQPTLSEASPAGHRLALILLCLAIGNSALVVGLSFLEQRWRPSRPTQRIFASMLLVTCLVALLAVFARYGNPVSVAERGYNAFVSSPPRVEGSLNRRLFNLSNSGRLPQWRVGWAQARAHPWLGSGAGTYELAWNKQRPVVGHVRDAHNLYLETLAELGPVGLFLLVVALGTVCVVGVRARRQPLVPAALGAYVAYCGHSAIDWDWEIPAVTFAALACAGVVLVAAREERLTWTVVRGRRAIGVLLAAVLGAFALVGLLGNSKLASARAAADHGRWQAADRSAHSASRWAPWSAAPWEVRALAGVGEGRLADARQRFRVAIEKDPSDWLLWFELAQASRGAAARHALTIARSLNPRSPEIAQYVADRSAAVGR